MQAQLDDVVPLLAPRAGRLGRVRSSSTCMKLPYCSRRPLLPPALATAFLGLSVLSDFAAEPELHVLWNTISPDGKYAMAWSTSGSVALDDLPLPDENDNNPVSNHVIEVAPRKILLTLLGGHYWEGYGAARPNHFSLETVWSEDSRSMLAIYDSRWSSIDVFLVDVAAPRVARIEQQLLAGFRRTLEAEHGREYAKHKDSLEIMFGWPWFLAPGRFSVWADAEIPKQGDPDFTYDLYFQTEDNGTNVTMVKAEPNTGEESADRSLNRIYRSLHGLLSLNDQKALVEEERAWLVKRDAIKTEKEKEAFVRARIDELKARVDSIVEEREKP